MTLTTLIVTDTDHVFGSPDATLEVIEYGDYECPYCGRAYPMLKNIQEKLGKEMRFVFRNFPLKKIHPHSFAASMATEAAALQGKFWEMHDSVFENQQSLSDEKILELAQTIGLDMKRFKVDILRSELAEKVEKDFKDGIRIGVNRTPSFFANGKKYEGNLEERNILQFLEDQLVANPSTDV